jgi:uncharacterized protein (UPF0335 family)
LTLVLVCDKIYNMENEKPSIPDDASEIYDSLEERDQWRKKAVDIARQKAEEAQTDEEREYFRNLAGTMSDIRFELHELFPEVFDD